jgi:hypothetical protein
MEKRRYHKKKTMKRNKTYRITEAKLVEAHRWRCGCNCSDIVLNLISGELIWTRVEFKCGERIKINCHCLEKYVG